jgi:amyloid beta A4 precursor protein-binding family A member 2
MDHALRTISYIADIGDLLVIMVRRGPLINHGAEIDGIQHRSQTKICCHVFESEEVK